MTTRRDFIAGAAALAGAVLATPVRAGTESNAMTPPTPDDALLALDATRAVTAMRHGEITAERYAEALLARCAAGASSNAFVTLEPERVREHARAADIARGRGATLGPLHGLPVPIKDSVDTIDLPTSVGTRALRGVVPPRDAEVVARLRAAGAFPLGKTNIHELSFGWSSANGAFGPVRNPYDAERIPGGSTGGTAAAVAARMAPLGVAEDTQGSIRVPAALCGVLGFRPTLGRYPTAGTAPITPVFDQIGPHARSVADLALFDAVMTGDDRPLPALSLAGVRLGVLRDFHCADADSEVVRVFDDALARLRAAGCVVVESSLPELAGYEARVTGPMQIHDVVPSLERYLRERAAPVDFAGLFAQVSPDIRATFERFCLPGAPQGVDEASYRHARDVLRPRLQHVLASWFARENVAAMVLPTTMIAAPRIDALGAPGFGEARVSFNAAMGRNIAPGSTAGIPGLVVPAGLGASTGMPIAIEFDAPAGSDRRLLALGAAVARVLPALPPPVL